MSVSSLALVDPTELVGAWVLSRIVDDRLAGVEHRIDGLLELSATGPGLIRWQESGRWHQPTGDVDVRRELRLELDEDAGWWVRFEDGRDFHPWAPGEQVVHPCSPDTYRGLVAGTPERWTVRWDVSGPDKDYTMTTVLSPCADGP